MGTMNLSSFSVSQSNFLKNRSFYLSSEFDKRKLSVKFVFSGRVRCNVKEGDSQDDGDELPESLFMKELRRRGMAPSVLEESKSIYADEDIKYIDEDGSFYNRNSGNTEIEKSLSDQREPSMALNSEGLEGLVARAKLLLIIGGTFLLGFWRLILTIVGFFLALYLCFGPTFVHIASLTPVLILQYVDTLPSSLLENKTTSHSAPSLN